MEKDAGDLFIAREVRAVTWPFHHYSEYHSVPLFTSVAKTLLLKLSVQLSYRLSQVLVSYMRINLCRTWILMAKELFNQQYLYVLLYQIRSKGASQRVKVDLWVYTRSTDGLLKLLADKHSIVR